MTKEEYINYAEDIAKKSHCVSHKVGAVIVKNGSIVSVGINGTPAGFTNCDEVFKEEFDRKTHHEFSEKFEIHAEMNAILNAAKNGVSVKDAEIYLTLHPCNNCLKMLCNAGIKAIYYKNEYDLFDADPDLDKMLEFCKIKMEKI